MQKRCLYVSFLILCLFVSGCSALQSATLQRGFTENTFISTGQPPVSITSPLPLKAEGQADILMNIEMQLKKQQSWIGVYGAENATSPMAIVAYSVVPDPNDAYQWNYPSTSFPDGPELGKTLFSERPFSMTARVINAENDAFMPLVLNKDTAKDVQWLAARYSLLSNERRSKIILEYREPLPQWAENMKSNTALLLLHPEWKAFATRAQEAFLVDFRPNPINRVLTKNVLNTIDLRHLASFLGSISYVNPPFIE